jgi:hypothetical protein
VFRRCYECDGQAPVSLSAFAAKGHRSRLTTALSSHPTSLGKAMRRHLPTSPPIRLHHLYQTSTSNLHVSFSVDYYDVFLSPSSLQSRTTTCTVYTFSSPHFDSLLIVGYISTQRTPGFTPPSPPSPLTSHGNMRLVYGPST